ncbi:MAG: Gfo/Idh/MocA family oxidoreductase [Planctomycetes bacterium]|nr:Gfo/Idh/MocA family oxidoreductase [Planctomycetota bacterium]
MSARIRVGQIGVGHFGGYRRQKMRETGLFELAAAYDLNPGALEQARKQDGAQPVGSYAELLAFPGLEGIVISTGAKFHAEHLIAALRAGKHVFVEKPLCSTLDEVRAIRAAAAASGRVVAVGHTDHTRDAETQAIKKLIESGRLGTIATFEKTTAHSGGLVMQPGDWRADPDKNPGGMLFQCGVHGVHELRYLFGPVTHVSAMMRYDANPATGTADVAICHLRFASGLIGTLNAYHVTPYRHTFSVFGTQGNVYRDARSFDEGTRLWLQETKLDHAKELQVPVPLEGTDDECGNLKSWAHAIRENGTPYPSLEDGIEALAVVFAAEVAAKEGRTVAVADFT